MSQSKSSIKKPERELKTVPISSVEVWDEANARHREITEDIDELAANIAVLGLQQPPLVQETDGHYKLILGQRRLYALRQLGRKEIPVIILREPYDLTKAKLASLSENLHRRPVVAGDIAEACVYFLKKFGSEKEAAKLLGISIQTFRKYLGFQGVPAEIKALVPDVISVPDAKRLAEIEPDVKKAVEFAHTIAKLPKPARNRYFVALMESPDAPLDYIAKRAETLRYKATLKIHLPENYARALSRASTDQNREPEDLAQKAVIEWLDRSGYKP